MELKIYVVFNEFRHREFAPETIIIIRFFYEFCHRDFAHAAKDFRRFQMITSLWNSTHTKPTISNDLQYFPPSWIANCIYDLTRFLTPPSWTWWLEIRFDTFPRIPPSSICKLTPPFFRANASLQLCMDWASTYAMLHLSCRSQQISKAIETTKFMIRRQFHWSWRFIVFPTNSASLNLHAKSKTEPVFNSCCHREFTN